MTRRRAPRGGGPASILVVEDDEPIRLALRELLECEGYDVVLAADGQEALEAVADEIPALVLTDVQMPLLDGAELCERLRNHRTTQDVPIVVLTAARSVDGIERLADAVMRKPFDIDALLAVIAQFIRTTVPPRPSVLLSTGRFRAVTAHPTLVLYVTPGSAACARAEKAVRSVLETDLHESMRPFLDVVDVLAHRDRADDEGVAMTPTLARTNPFRRELFLGDLSDLKVLRAFLMQLD
jgi:CheY-like chemotaxis protein